MKKKSVLYFTIMPSPFQLEFLNYLNDNSSKYNFVPIFMSKIPEYRKTWGNVGENYIFIDEDSLIQQYKKILSIIKEKQPQKIIVTQYNKLYTHLIIIYAIMNGIKYYIGPIENMHKRNLMFDFVKKIYFSIVAKKATALFAIGNNAAKDYSQIYKGKVLNIPYTFDLKHLFESKKKNIKTNITTFLYSGRLIHFRNPILVIESFAEVANEYENVQLIMSGKGELKNTCDQKIQELGIKDKVVWKNDFKDWYDIHKNLYRQADVLLALQHYSTWGLIIQEAMAAGLGIIATRTMESTTELIVDGYNGFLVNLDKDEVVSKMKKYIENKALISKHVLRSQDIVQVVDLKNVGNNLLEFFESD